jgi:hypothetical protein
VELAGTNGERDTCANALEDALFLSEADKKRMLDTVRLAVERLKRARDPCGRFKAVFRPRSCSPDASLSAQELEKR